MRDVAFETEARKPPFWARAVGLLVSLIFFGGREIFRGTMLLLLWLPCRLSILIGAFITLGGLVQSEAHHGPIVTLKWFGIILLTWLMVGALRWLEGRIYLLGRNRWV